DVLNERHIDYKKMTENDATKYIFTECLLRSHTVNEKDEGHAGSQGNPALTLFSNGNIAYWCYETTCQGMKHTERMEALAESLDAEELRPRKSGYQIFRELQGGTPTEQPERAVTDEDEEVIDEACEDVDEYHEENICKPHDEGTETEPPTGDSSGDGGIWEWYPPEVAVKLASVETE